MQSEANHLLVSKIERKEKAMRRGDEFAILFVESGIIPFVIKVLCRRKVKMSLFSKVLISDPIMPFTFTYKKTSMYAIT